jgi:hypothetical protein
LNGYSVNINDLQSRLDKPELMSAHPPCPLNWFYEKESYLLPVNLNNQSDA